MLGICFGIMQNFRHGFSDRNLGFAMLFALVLLIVAVPQTLLDIYPRPGHEYVGSAVLGLHMPVWSVVIATACIAAISLKLVILGSEQGKTAPRRGSRTAKVAALLSVIVLAIAAVNTASVFVQCRVSPCHTDGYALLR